MDGWWTERRDSGTDGRKEGRDYSTVESEWWSVSLPPLFWPKAQCWLMLTQWEVEEEEEDVAKESGGS